MAEHPSPPRRLSRSEQQHRTREAILRTATEHFLELGYHGTSLDAIAAAAGFSKGAVYSNFDGKEGLCLEVIDRVRSDRLGRLTERIGDAGPAWEDRVQAVQAWAEDVIGDPGWTFLEVEFATVVRHSPDLVPEVSRRQAALVALLADVLETQATEAGLTLRLPPQDAATAVLSLGIGLGVQRAVAPHLPVDVLGATMRALVTPDPTEETR